MATLTVNGGIGLNSLYGGVSTSLCVIAIAGGYYGIASCSSSRRYKENIKDAPFGLDEVMKMRPVTFKWKGRDENDFGLVAEEMEQINPLFVTSKHDRVEGVKYPQLTAVLVGAVKQQQGEIEQVKSANDDLRKEMTQLQAGVKALVKAFEELKALFSSDHVLLMKLKDLFDSDHKEIEQLKAANDNLRQANDNLRQASDKQAKDIGDLRAMIIKENHEFNAYKKAHP